MKSTVFLLDPILGKKPQKFSLIHNLANRLSDQCVQNFGLFTSLTPLMALKMDVTEVGKTKDQLTFQWVPSGGEILN